ncbi:hypothetical protein ACLB1N_16845 [Escherichia coli]
MSRGHSGNKVTCRIAIWLTASKMSRHLRQTTRHFLHVIISSYRSISHAQPWLNRMLRMCRHYWGKGDSEWKNGSTEYLPTPRSGPELNNEIVVVYDLFYNVTLR